MTKTSRTNHEPHDHRRCVTAAMRKAQDICLSRAARLTEQRRKVLELVWSEHRAIKAYDLLARLDEGKGRVKPPTVYRALDFLVGHGLVHKIESLNAYVGCPSPDSEHVGEFLICEGCGVVEELRIPSLGQQLNRAVHQAGFALRRPLVELHGLCHDCQVAS